MSKTLNQIIKDAGIKTIRPEDKKKAIKLSFNGKEIIRPIAEKCYLVVKNEFGINLKEFE